MRINVYAEELTDRVELVHKPMDDDPLLAGVMFHAVRLYLGFPFIHRQGDDDSSAVTFWVPWTRKDGHDFARLSALLRRMADALDDEAVRDLNRQAQA